MNPALRAAILEQLYERPDRKEKGKRHERQSQQHAVRQRLQRHIGGHRRRIIFPLHKLDWIVRCPPKSPIRDFPRPVGRLRHEGCRALVEHEPIPVRAFVTGDFELLGRREFVSVPEIAHQAWHAVVHEQHHHDANQRQGECDPHGFSRCFVRMRFLVRIRFLGDPLRGP